MKKTAKPEAKTKLEFKRVAIKRLEQSDLQNVDGANCIGQHPTDVSIKPY